MQLLVRKEMIPFNDNCIKAFLKGEAKDLLSNVKELSHFLIAHLDPMIPKKFRKVWKQGLESESYYLKLCGSGGGGYLLGFAPDLEKARADLKEFNIEVIHRFFFGTKIRQPSSRLRRFGRKLPICALD